MKIGLSGEMVVEDELEKDGTLLIEISNNPFESHGEYLTRRDGIKLICHVFRRLILKL